MYMYMYVPHINVGQNLCINAGLNYMFKKIWLTKDLLNVPECSSYVFQCTWQVLHISLEIFIIKQVMFSEFLHKMQLCIY